MVVLGRPWANKITNTVISGQFEVTDCKSTRVSFWPNVLKILIKMYYVTISTI